MKLLTKLLMFKRRLMSFNQEEPLSKLSLIVIILLDIFWLYVVFWGLNAHTSQLASPNEYIPYECRRVMIENQWSEANKLDKLQAVVLQDYNNYLSRYSVFGEERLSKMHPDCRQYFDRIKVIAENIKIKRMFIERQTLQRKLKDWDKKQSGNKGVYDTKLLESIATDKGTDRSNLSLEMKSILAEYEKVITSIQDISSKISEQQLVADFWGFLGPFNSGLRQRLIADFKHYEIVYAFKEFCWQLLFLLPIFAVAMFWYIRSVNRDFAIQVLFSAHLLTIASIPILIKIIKLVIDLIPNKFFRTLFDMLERMHIVAIWHYLLIVVSILTAILIVYIIQKKFFNKQRVYEKRLIAGKCCLCGKKLPPNDKLKNCPFCGKSQMRQCPNCQSQTYLGGNRCVSCGE